MEQVLYDTSALIKLYRENVKELKGYTTILNIVEFPKALEMKLRVVYPSVEDYRLAVVIAKDLIKAGTPVPAVDIVIAAVALNRGFVLVTEDKHFAYIQSVREDLELAEP